MAAIASIDEFSSWMIAAFDRMCDEHRGPMQFLETTLASDAEQVEFMNFLDRIIPDVDSAWSPKDGAPGDNELFFASPKQLCYRSVATTKRSPITPNTIVPLWPSTSELIS